VFALSRDESEAEYFKLLERFDRLERFEL
jgi:hypothetical protein